MPGGENAGGKILHAERTLRFPGTPLSFEQQRARIPLAAILFELVLTSESGDHWAAQAAVHQTRSSSTHGE